jgi:putative Mg2+ transporter-C (MgtC) family protein
MLARFAVALVLGAILGVERELVKKEAGVRTEMLVAGGASLFAMIGLMLPYITASGLTAAIGINIKADASTINAGLAVIANIVVGIGFLGAGLIIHDRDRAHGVTTAALVWMTAAIGALAGIGLLMFATIATLFTVIFLFGLRKLNVLKQFEEMLSKPAKTSRKMKSPAR